MIVLRKNQSEPIAKAKEFFAKKNSEPSLIVLPTAWGKSILTAFVAKDITDKLLVLQPSKELLEQNYKKYISLCGDDFEAQAGVYSASFGRKDVNKVTYATIGSIKNIGKLFKQLGFTRLLIDEAHLYPRGTESMFAKFLEDSEITHVLGITATPIKLQSNTDMSGQRFSKLQMLTSRSAVGQKDGIARSFYKDIIHVSQVSEMVEMGFWSKLLYKATTFDGTQLVYNSSRSEFTEESVQQAFGKNNIHAQIKRELDENQDRKHILVFVPSIAEAKRLSAEYPNSAAIYGDMDTNERARIIEEFRAGLIRVIFNVRVLSTGFDYTGLDCLILGISTASIALYYQILGRLTRIDPNKKDGLVIDLCGNVERFGRVEDISFVKEKAMWKMYGSGGRLLSGVPIHEIGSVIKQSTENKPEAVPANFKPIEIMPYGKYKGEEIMNIPPDYRQWMLEKFDWHKGNLNLKLSIQQTLI
jgi:DNA repair protein RadD